MCFYVATGVSDSEGYIRIEQDDKTFTKNIINLLWSVVQYYNYVNEKN